MHTTMKSSYKVLWCKLITTTKTTTTTTTKMTMMMMITIREPIVWKQELPKSRSVLYVNCSLS